MNITVNSSNKETRKTRVNIPNSTFQRNPLLKPVFQCQVYREEVRNNERQTISVIYLLKKLPHFTFNWPEPVTSLHSGNTVCSPDFTVNQWDEKLLHKGRWEGLEGTQQSLPFTHHSWHSHERAAALKNTGFSPARMYLLQGAGMTYPASRDWKKELGITSWVSSFCLSLGKQPVCRKHTFLVPPLGKFCRSKPLPGIPLTIQLSLRQGGNWFHTLL